MLNDPLCCRTFFNEDECLKEPQSKILEYNSYQFPFPVSQQFYLKRTICGMMNTVGGIIILGIKITSNNTIIVINSTYNEEQKKSILRQFENLQYCINPKTSPQNRYLKVQFVPIKARNSKQYIQGGYVIRVKVNKGNEKNVYLFEDKNQRHCYLRMQRSVIKINSNYTTEQIKDVIKKQNQNKTHHSVVSWRHQEPCKQPEKGSPKQTNLKQQSLITPLRQARIPQQKQFQENQFTKTQQFRSNYIKESYLQKDPQTPCYNRKLKTQADQQDSKRQPFLRQSKTHKKQHDQIVVIINFPKEHIQFLLNKKSQYGLSFSQTIDMVVIYAHLKDLANLKDSFKVYNSNQNQKAIFLQATPNLSFQKESEEDWQNIMMFLEEFSKSNHLPGIKLWPKSKLAQLPDKNVGASVFMMLSEQGVRPRFKN